MPRSMLFNFPIAKNEYPSVRNFAIQKKIALMSAHNSIITARVKQTRNAIENGELNRSLRMTWCTYLQRTSHSPRGLQGN